MIKSMLRCAAVLAAGAAVLVPTAPAHATVHEIVGQWCSGQDELAPPGISGRSKADNVARPLTANGFVGAPVPFSDGALITFNYNHPASKVVGTGIFIVIAETPEGPLYLELIKPDPNFPAFKHCPRLATG